MDRWNKWKTVTYDDLDDPSDPGGEGSDLEGNQSGKQTPSSDLPTGDDDQTTSIQTPFRHPTLQGLTEEQIAERLAVANSTVKSQGQRLSLLEQELRKKGEPTPAPEPDPEVSAQDFFADPGKHISSIVGREVERRLKSTVDPLLSDLKRNAVRTAWDEVKSRYQNFDTYRGAIEEKFRLWGIPEDNLTADAIETVYQAVVGEAYLAGRISEEPSGVQPSAGTEPPAPRINPQLRPSSQPIRPGGGDKKKRRELTEEERHFARVNKMSHDDFLDFLEADETDVAESKIGLEKGA